MNTGYDVKTIAIMQPYFLPYIGYFQLFDAADVFVFLDDVQYIKRGWVNRNRILVNGSPLYITLPVSRETSSRSIRECVFSIDEIEKTKKNILLTIQRSYAKAPFFESVCPLIEKIINNETSNVSEFTQFSIRSVLSFLGIEFTLLRSSELNINKSAKGQDRIIAITKALQGARYINAIGGIELYNSADFMKEGIELKFIYPQIVPYRQFQNEFVPNLSIIDVLMFNSKQEVLTMLKHYTVIDEKS